MRAKHAREIRAGITIARDVMRGARRMPRMTPFGFRGAPEPQLWERAFYRTFKPFPPRGPAGNSGVSR